MKPDPLPIESINHVADSRVTQYFFRDPDGYHIEIGSYPPVRQLDE